MVQVLEPCTRITFFGKVFEDCRGCGSREVEFTVENATLKGKKLIEILLTVECQDCGLLDFDRHWI